MTAFPHLKEVKNLIFEGGGVKGIAYLGALQRLYESISPSQIQGVGGASAGAITAMVVSFGLDYPKSKAIADTLDFSKVRQTPGPDDFPNLSKFEKKLLEGVSDIFGGDIWSLLNLHENYGWYSSDYFFGWLQQTIAGQFGKGSSGLETFADFRKQGLHDLRVKATDVSTRSSVTLCYANSPGMPVAKAVRQSMSIPLFFQGIEQDGSWFCDGGVLRNYPIDLFDDDSDCKPHQTLGFRLFTPQGTSPGSNFPLDDPPAPPRKCPPERPVTSLISYIEGVMEAVLNAASLLLPEDVDRTVSIDNYCVSTTDFGIQPKTADYNGLVNNGYRATDEFLKSWPPSPPPDLTKRRDR